jgi:hypothetical protein
MPAGRHDKLTAWIAAALYLVAAVVVTWPLATVIDSEIAWDMGDPLFNSWVLMWTGGQVLSFLSGDLSAMNRFWDGNIFYPEPLTIAFSEHLVPQMVQALPVLAATDNVVLAYNLLFLSTFVLSGLGVFLLVRSLTGSATAGFVAGLAFAFAPYRIAQFSHLQVLSSQWMPFVLYGYRRYFETGRRAPLIGGTSALVLQNLSCGYYLLFFAPFVALYVIYEMASRGRLGDWKMWRTWIVTGALALAVTYPFLDPYFEVRKSGDVGVRDAGEIIMFSADTHAFATASGWSWLWAERLPGLPRPEGEGFPGVAIALLAFVGVGAGTLRAMREGRKSAAPAPPPWRQTLIGMLALLVVVHGIGVLVFLATGGLPIPYKGAWAIHRSADAVFFRTVWLVGLLLVASPGLRSFLRGVPNSLLGFFALSTVLAAILALGPQISAAGHLIGVGPYAWLVAYVPGFDGVRVPARYLMLVALFLACLAGYGAAALLRWRPRAAAGVLVVVSLLMLVESLAWPFQTNTRLAADGYEVTPRELRTASDLPPIYKVLRDDPHPVILVEFPFGSPAWDLHSVFYAGYHKRPLVNGYSGFFPESQRTLSYVFTLVGSDPDAAWRALLGTRATHILVREAAFIPSQRGLVSDWLRSRGAEQILVDGSDRLFRMKRP